jgi:hypothetical protein
MMKARLVVLLFAPAQWLLVWALRFVVELPINRQVKAIIAALAGAVVVLGTWFTQGRLYYSMTGVGIPAQDNYFFSLVIGECVVSMGIIFLLAFELKKKESDKRD